MHKEMFLADRAEGRRDGRGNTNSECRDGGKTKDMARPSMLLFERSLVVVWWQVSAKERTLR